MKKTKLPLKALSKVAGLFALTGANLLCWWIAHEPEMPEEVKKMRKF
ncbi:cyclic lactone autoinducer peptide [Paenibacillus odorifer]|nr:cyclic lactone autoinducer peptide [Paenibacillus odorifer]